MVGGIGPLANRRLYHLDLLRFLAAMAVLLFHYTFRGPLDAGLGLASYPALDGWSRYGHLGVHLFFMISGFVITLSAAGRDLRAFAVSRVTRLYPAYWFACTLTFLWVLAFGPASRAVAWPDWLAGMTMLNGQPGLDGTRLVDGVYWTLAIELRFYLFIALLLATNQLRHLERYCWGWLGIAALDAAWPLPPLLGELLLLDWAPYFAAGIVFYLRWAGGGSPARHALLWVSLLMAILELRHYVWNLHAHYHTDFSVPVSILILLLFFAIFHAIARGGLESLNRPVFYVLGLLTYPLYLLHQNIGYSLLGWLAPAGPWTALAGTALLSLLLAFLVQRHVELPVARRMKVLLSRKSGQGPE